MNTYTRINPEFFTHDYAYYKRFFHRVSTSFGVFTDLVLEQLSEHHLSASLTIGTNKPYRVLIYFNTDVFVGYRDMSETPELAREGLSHQIKHELEKAKLITTCSLIDVEYELMNEHARVPERAHWNDAAYDLWAYTMEEKDDGRLMYHTGLKMAMPDNYVGLVFPRSSTSKLNLVLGNCVAVFDAGYRGEVMIPYKTLHHAITASSDVLSAEDKWVPTHIHQVDPNTDRRLRQYEGSLKRRYNVSPNNPQRIAQILFIPRTEVKWRLVKSVDTSLRGAGNFGHTGQGTILEQYPQESVISRDQLKELNRKYPNNAIQRMIAIQRE